MKLKRITVALMLGTAIFAMTACGKSKAPEEVQKSEESDIKVPVEEAETPIEEANVSIYYVSDEELDSLSEYSAVVDPAFDNEENKPYLRNVIVKTDAAITGVKILDCETGMCTEDSTEMIVKDVAYDYGDLDENTPLIIQTTFPGSASVRGLSYIDTTGNEKVFILSESGKDGSLVVTPAYIKQ